MNAAELRSKVKQLYPISLRWHQRVDRMSEAQVWAIWQRSEKLRIEKEELDEEYSQFHDALRDEEDTSKLEEIFKQEALF